MAGFKHGKNTRVFIDQYDLSRYFTDAQLSAKVEMADTTTFARTPGIAVSKTVIPGVKTGSMTLKGLFDSTALSPTTASSALDAYFYNLVAQETGVGTVSTPSNVETIVTVCPDGFLGVGKNVWCGAGVAANVQTQAPVKNVVMTQATIEADGGIDTGVCLHDPTTSDTIPGGATLAVASQSVALPVASITVNSTTTYLAAGTIFVPLTGGGYASVAYTSVDATHFLGCTGGTGTTLGSAGAILQAIPQAGVNDQGLPLGSATTVAYGATPVNGSSLNLTTASFAFNTTTSPILAGFPANGQILVPISGGSATVTYTGLLSTGFTGCTVNAAVTATASSNATLPPIVSIRGAYGLLHLGVVTGGTLTIAKLQSSEDNAAWVDVPGGSWSLTNAVLNQWGSGQTGGSAGGPGGYILFIPPGVSVNRFVRCVLGYGAGVTAATALISFVRL